MGGLQHYRMAMDPAIQKLGTMTTNRHKFFRWTPRTAGLTFVYAVAVPFVVGVIAYQTDRSEHKQLSSKTKEMILFVRNIAKFGRFAPPLCGVS
ncbi:hypothetical protein F5X98DRAFT_379869 [Xylaria grammica]|nr:hypothetical protein F5X98DRAFT_379869 [Xylaria grammica]